MVNKFAYVYSVQEEFLQTALASINQHYGNIDTWLEKDIGFNLDAQSRESLQNYFLE